MTYQDIILNKFTFLNGHLDQELEDLVWSLEYPDTGESEGEVQFKIQKVKEETRNKIIKYLLKELDLEDELKEQIKKFDFDINKMTKGEWIPMHNEVSQLSPFEIILWLTKSDDYEGREFIMQDGDIEIRHRPKNFDICLVDTTHSDVYHGVSELLTDISIISITGGLGKKEDAVRN